MCQKHMVGTEAPSVGMYYRYVGSPSQRRLCKVKESLTESVSQCKKTLISLLSLVFSLGFVTPCAVQHNLHPSGQREIAIFSKTMAQ